MVMVHKLRTREVVVTELLPSVSVFCNLCPFQLDTLEYCLSVN